jgi:catechol 2,3-dioxygenase-like lactoylglutathione lyase family enzyme
MQLRLNIDVPDLPAAVDFYTRALGLRQGRRLFAGEVVELLGAQLPIYLLAKPAGSAPFTGSQQGRGYQRHWTPLHLDLLVEDLDAAVAQAQAAGARREGEVGDYIWGRLARMSDPFGHGFCLMQWRGRGYEQVAD